MTLKMTTTCFVLRYGDGSKVEDDGSDMHYSEDEAHAYIAERDLDAASLDGPVAVVVAIPVDTCVGVTCDTCKATVRDAEDGIDLHLRPGDVQGHLNDAGWETAGERHYCGNCVALEVAS